MKQIFLFFILLLVTQSSFADCSSQSLWAFPKGDKIYQNSWIVLEGYGRLEAIIPELNKEYPVFLESATHKVPLTIKETHKGQMSIKQAILQHNEKLIVGEKYFLKIENLPKPNRGNELERYNYEDSKSEPIAWTVLEGSDTEMPKLIKKPTLVDKQYIQYGCGPEEFAVFEFEVEDESELLIETELVDLTTDEKTSYFLTTFYRESNKVSVGHGMCSGAFKYLSDGNYQVRFKFYDASGNTTGWLPPMIYNIP